MNLITTRNFQKMVLRGILLILLILMEHIPEEEWENFSESTKGQLSQYNHDLQGVLLEK